jgi:hypothetical protein
VAEPPPLNKIFVATIEVSTGAEKESLITGLKLMLEKLRLLEEPLFTVAFIKLNGPAGISTIGFGMLSFLQEKKMVTVNESKNICFTRD